MACQQYFSHVKALPREMEKEKKNMIDEKKNPIPEFASSEATTFLESYLWQGKPFESFNLRVQHHNITFL